MTQLDDLSTSPVDDDQVVKAAQRGRRLRVGRPEPVGPAPLDLGDPGPQDVRVTTRHLTRRGRPFVPVMGEYHFSRDRPERWETELAAMRSGGVTVVATYVLWILHEERRGQVRFDGPRDLRRFVELARDAGLEVVLRIGPWAHGETRNGGFPDWLQELPVAHRTDDPAYLELVRSWFAAIAEQVEGLLQTDRTPDGPVVGVQVENELYDQPGHLATLRTLAEEAGITAPVWVATGWGGAQLPARRLLPVYAGYADGFWEEASTGWPDFGATHFTFSTVRDDLTVGADLRAAQDLPVGESQPPAPAEATDLADPWPFVTCELGGGMHVAYHRRPHVDPADVTALALTKLGSGSAWQGYYLYHGVAQVRGELGPTHESHDSGYPNDVPVVDYDFFAPLGAHGQQRPHFHGLRLQHLFLEAFGDSLADCPAVLPAPGDPLRWSVRSDGERGYLFINNHQPAAASLPPVPQVQLTVELADGRSVSLPSVDAPPVTLASGEHLLWPVRQPYGSVPAVSATAQPVTRLDTADGTVVVLAASEGIPVELQLEGVRATDVHGATTRQVGQVVVATPVAAPGLGCEVRVGDTTFVVLDRDGAEAVWRGRVAGRDRIVLWRGEAWFAGDEIHIVVPDTDATLHVLPALGEATSVAAEGTVLSAADGTVFTRYAVPGDPQQERALPAPGVLDAPCAPIRTGGSLGRRSAPTDQDFAASTPVRVAIPEELLEGAVTVDGGDRRPPGGDARLLLTLGWTGDVLRVYAGEELIADQFWSGRELEIDLAPYRETIRSEGLWLRGFAWDPTTQIHVDPRVRPQVREPVLEVHSVRLRHRRSVAWPGQDSAWPD